MQNEQSPQTYDVSIADLTHMRQQAQERQSAANHERPMAPYTYRLKLGRETIWLSIIEFRILSFLAAKPYRAFSRRHIVHAVSTDRYPVMEETIDRHVASLREKLGFFRDFIQSVPYVGYRFKA